MLSDNQDFFSQQLLEREKTFRLKNQQITSQLNNALSQVETVVVSFVYK